MKNDGLYRLGGDRLIQAILTMRVFTYFFQKFGVSGASFEVKTRENLGFYNNVLKSYSLFFSLVGVDKIRILFY